MARDNGSNGKRKNGRRAHDRHRDRSLVIIGGSEDKEGDRIILREVARRCRKEKLVVTAVASEQPEILFETYDRVFRELGVREVVNLELRTRCDAMAEERVRLLDDATGVFFTGGDQLRITSQIGDTPIFHRLIEIYEEGGVIAGTSAGASVMCETMLVRGGGGESHRIGDLQMSPGLGLITNAIIDQHFAERGRMGRLLGAVAYNPRELGIGIDEDTAIIVEEDERFHVLGRGAVYVVDGSAVTQSNITESASDRVLSMYDVKLHVLSEGDRFDLRERRPGVLSPIEVAEGHLEEAKALEN